MGLMTKPVYNCKLRTDGQLKTNSDWAQKICSNTPDTVIETGKELQKFNQNEWHIDLHDKQVNFFDMIYISEWIQQKKFKL